MKQLHTNSCDRYIPEKTKPKKHIVGNLFNFSESWFPHHWKGTYALKELFRKDLNNKATWPSAWHRIDGSSLEWNYNSHYIHSNSSNEMN